MTATPEWHKEARRLHEETDLRQCEIAERLGKSKSSVWRALHPEESAAKETARRPYKRAWDNENLYDTCECGRRKQRSRARCRTCYLNGKRFERRFGELMLIEMWRDG